MTFARFVALRELIDRAPDTRRAEQQLPLLPDGRRGSGVWCAGDLSLARCRSVAVVGTRSPSPAGCATARRLAAALGGAGFVIVSGLARGIDTEAMSAALDSGGRVIGVIGTPLDVAYPPENAPLQQRIRADHLLVSPYEPGRPVVRGNFPARNRLMAALSEGTAIVEAGDRSGALHQASECLRLGRWLFICENVVNDPSLTWPARFVGHRRVRVVAAAGDVLAALDG